MEGFELFELEEELHKTEIVIDVDRLTKSNIKQIIMPLHRFIEWRCVDKNNKFLRKSEIFNGCLTPEDAEKAKTLNRLSCSHIWNLLDDKVKANMNFDDFVN